MAFVDAFFCFLDGKYVDFAALVVCVDASTVTASSSRTLVVSVGSWADIAMDTDKMINETACLMLELFMGMMF